MPLTDVDRAKQIADFTRRYPQLAVLPEAERMPIVRRAAFNPLVWGTGLLILAATLPIVATILFAAQGDGSGRPPLGVAVLLGVGMLIAILPAVIFVQGRVINRLIARRLAEDA